jgi:hypothetical protein
MYSDLPTDRPRSRDRSIDRERERMSKSNVLPLEVNSSVCLWFQVFINWLTKIYNIAHLIIKIYKTTKQMISLQISFCKNFHFT